MGIRVYFSQHPADFHTDRSSRAVDAIRATFGVALESIIDSSLLEGGDPEFNRARVLECDVVVFLANEDGTMGPLVAADVMEAQVRGTPVYCIVLVQDGLVVRPFKWDSVQTVEASNELIRRTKGAVGLAASSGPYGVSEVLGSREAMAEEMAVEEDDVPGMPPVTEVTGFPNVTAVNSEGEEVPATYEDWAKEHPVKPVVSD